MRGSNDRLGVLAGWLAGISSGFHDLWAVSAGREGVRVVSFSRRASRIAKNAFGYRSRCGDVLPVPSREIDWRTSAPDRIVRSRRFELCPKAAFARQQSRCPADIMLAVPERGWWGIASMKRAGLLVSRTLTFAALGLLAQFATAQTVAVETALLADASGPARLVLAHWPGRGWVVRQSGAIAEILLPGEALQIGLPNLPQGWADGALLGIATRVTPTGTMLELTLGCECRLAIEGDGEARLAIDIVGARLAAGPVLRAAGPAPAWAPLPPGRPAQVSVAAGGAGVGSTPRETDAMEVALDEARARLLEQLERAAAAGIIDLAPVDGDSRSMLGPDRRELPASVLPAAPPAPGALSLARRQTVPSGAELEGGQEPAPAPVTRAAQAAGPTDGSEGAALDRVASMSEPRDCWPDTAFSLPPVAPGQQFATSLGMLRAGLLGEFDRVDPAGALDLARLYIAHGLGDEALALLEGLAPDAPQALLVRGLALIVAERLLPAGHPLLVPACGGLQALWRARALAQQDDPASAIEGLAMADLAIEGIDIPQRTELAAQLGLAAADAGDWDGARRLRGLAGRGVLAGGTRPTRLVLLDARVARHDGDTSAALGSLRRLRRDPGPEGQQALLILASMVTQKEAGDPRDAHNLRLDLGAVALLERGTAIGEAAFAAELDLTDLAFGRAAALDLLSWGRDEGLLNDKAHLTQLARLSSPPEAAKDAAALALAHADSPERFAGALAEPGFRAALARSYAAIGLPLRGVGLLRDEDLGDPALTAEMSLALIEADRPEEAEAMLRRLPPGEERAALRATALEAADDPAGAMAALGSGGTARDRARLAWAAGDWAAAATALAELPEAQAEGPVATQLAIARARAPGQETAERATSFEPSVEGVTRLLESIRAETDAIREILDDG